jgi:uncharacterized protein
MVADFEVPLGRLFSVAPGLPTTDMARTIEHYGRLGFTFTAPGSALPAESGFAVGRRDGVELHFALKPDHDQARTATWVYIRVKDAGELHAEFEAAGAGQGRAPGDTDYQMRELAHIDPDGNLLLFGAPLSRAQLPGPPLSQPEPAASPPGPAASPPARAATTAGSRAFEFAAALKKGEADHVTALLAAEPGLATSKINGYWPLHLYADAPGHRPNPVAIVSALAAAGADLDTHASGTWHHETALHWAASNDDVELIDALLDAGADIEHPGSSIGGGPPAQSALGYGQWGALRRLYERGAVMGLSPAAALGLMPVVTAILTSDPAPDADDRSLALWNACRAGQIETAQCLAAHGADLNWAAPWSGETPLDAARAQHQRPVAAWLVHAGAHSGLGAAEK